MSVIPFSMAMSFERARSPTLNFPAPERRPLFHTCRTFIITPAYDLASAGLLLSQVLSLSALLRSIDFSIFVVDSMFRSKHRQSGCSSYLSQVQNNSWSTKRPPMASDHFLSLPLQEGSKFPAPLANSGGPLSSTSLLPQDHLGPGKITPGGVA